jgi:hypothetical protein
VAHRQQDCRTFLPYNAARHRARVRGQLPEFRDKGICGLKKPLFFMGNGAIDV